LRDFATLAILLGCGLRRAELTALRVEDIQQREEHWVIADLVRKGGHIRTIPVPDWVKAAIDSWMEGSGIADGILLRSINKAGRTWGDGFRLVEDSFANSSLGFIDDGIECLGLEFAGPLLVRIIVAELPRVSVGREVSYARYPTDTAGYGSSSGQPLSC